MEIKIDWDKTAVQPSTIEVKAKDVSAYKGSVFTTAVPEEFSNTVWGTVPSIVYETTALGVPVKVKSTDEPGHIEVSEAKNEASGVGE